MIHTQPPAPANAPIHGSDRCLDRQTDRLVPLARIELAPRPGTAPGLAWRLAFRDAATLECRAAGPGRWTLAVEVRRHDSEARPASWDRLHEALLQAGFAMDPLSDDLGELLLPSSFFSGDILLSAEKAYDTETLTELFPDAARLTARLGNEE